MNEVYIKHSFDCIDSSFEIGDYENRRKLSFRKEELDVFFVFPKIGVTTRKDVLAPKRGLWMSVPKWFKSH